jgi:hypothetical protein
MKAYVLSSIAELQQPRFRERLSMMTLTVQLLASLIIYC